MKENKKFVNACGRIFDFFDFLSDDGGTGNHPYHSKSCSVFDSPISNSFNAFNFLHRIKFENEKVEQKVLDKVQTLSEILFSIGFVIGRSFDITYREAKKDVETIEKVIQEKELLPYFPRERKAA